MKFDDIRKICLQYSNNPEIAFSARSDLCWYRYVRQIRNLAKLIPKNADVLEVGSGYGHTSVMLHELRPDIEILATDIEPHPSGCWSEFKKLGIKFQITNAENMNFKDECFNTIFSFGVLEHLNAEKFLSESYRILKKGGLFIVFNLPNEYSIVEYIAKKTKIYFHAKKYDINEIKNLVENYGFKIFSLKRKFIIPSQLNMLGDKLGKFSNITYKFLDKFDCLLMKTAFKYLSQSIEIYAKK